MFVLRTACGLMLAIWRHRVHVLSPTSSARNGNPDLSKTVHRINQVIHVLGVAVNKVLGTEYSVPVRWMELKKTEGKFHWEAVGSWHGREAIF